jgi:hypothetical protein
MKDVMNGYLRPVTRRSVLGVCLGATLCSQFASRLRDDRLEQGQVSKAVPGVINDRGASLFAFPSSLRATTVLAALWPASSAAPDHLGEGVELRIHAEPCTWGLEVPQAPGGFATRELNGSRVFVGRIGALPPHAQLVDALVAEVPNEQLAGVRGVWAERLSPHEGRRRIGSPFLAKLVAQDRELARLYHTLSPDDDRLMLTEGVARAVSTSAGTEGRAVNPDARTRRLAAILLPDVLPYNLALPPGFTFAARNGLHPDESSATVVDSILSGSVTTSTQARLSFRRRPTFPYFEHLAACA